MLQIVTKDLVRLLTPLHSVTNFCKKPICILFLLGQQARSTILKPVYNSPFLIIVVFIMLFLLLLFQLLWFLWSLTLLGVKCDGMHCAMHTSFSFQVPDKS